MDLIHAWHGDRNLFKILHGTITTPVHDIEVKVTNLEFFMLKFYFASFCRAFDGFDSRLA